MNNPMATGTLTTVEEYLNTSYSPDCDYVDGEVLERNVGEWDHARLQAALASYFYSREKQTGLLVVTEQRVQVTATRFRVPDICVIAGPSPNEQILHSPPFLCIEILFRDDRYTAIREKIDDYLRFGVKYVWVIDPATHRADVYSASGSTEVTDGILFTRDPDLAVPLSEL
jgi:Uma2 family endonuclease